jgi:hypothetical protein
LLLLIEIGKKFVSLTKEGCIVNRPGYIKSKSFFNLDMPEVTLHRSLLKDISRISASTRLHALPDGLICSLVDFGRLNSTALRMQYSLQQHILEMVS